MSHSERASKNPNPEFSRINGGGSTSATSTCCIDLEMSSTENGMLHSHKRFEKKCYSQDLYRQWCINYLPWKFIKHLESSSNRKEVLTALLESSDIIALMLDITCRMKEFHVEIYHKYFS